MASTDSAAVDSDDFARRSRDFVAWFRNAPGTRLSRKIELADLRHRGAGRGVVATQDIAQDEELFAIPRSLVLMATTTSLPDLPDAGSSSWLPLILATVQQLLSKEQSKWHAYLQVLPATFDSLMFWADDELAELQASAVRRRIGREQADAEFREKAWPLMRADPQSFKLAGATEAERAEEAVRLCHYAGSLIMAYAFDIDRDEDDDDDDDDDDEFQSDDEEDPLKGLVPFADMLNADADRNNARLFQEEGEDSGYLIMKAIKPIGAGQECLNDYGPLPRSELLRMYGYVTDAYTEYDVVDLELDLLEKAATAAAGGKERPSLESRERAWARKKARLEDDGLLDDGYSFPRPGGHSLADAIPHDLHTVLRGLCDTLLADNSTTSRSSSSGVSVKEASLLGAAASAKLAEYATSLDADLASLASPSAATALSRRHRLALQVRIGEKEILAQIIALCRDYMAANEGRATEQKRKAGSNNTTTDKHKKVKTGK